MHQASGRVAAEQGPLGAAQYFRPVNVEILQVQSADRGAVDTVKINGYRVFVEIGYFVKSDASQEEIDLAALSVRYRILQAGGHGRQVHGIRQTQFLDLLAGISGHGDTHILQVLFPFLCGHNDFFQHLGAGVERNSQ